MFKFWTLTQSRDSRQQKEVSVRGARKGEGGEDERLWKWISLTEASTSLYKFFRSGPKEGVVEVVAPLGLQGLQTSRGVLAVGVAWVVVARRPRVRSVVNMVNECMESGSLLFGRNE